MDQNAITDIYDQIAEEYARRYDPIESEEDLVFLNAFLSRLKSGDKVLDLGCGTGFSAGYFVKKGMIASGVDASKNMVAIAKRNYPNIPFVVADMRQYEPGETFDAVWAGYCLFHLSQDDFEETVRKIRGYLKPGGILGLVMQEGEGEVEVDEPLLPGVKNCLHLYTEEELRRLLEHAGFCVVEVKKKPPMYEMEFAYNKILLVAEGAGY